MKFQLTPWPSRRQRRAAVEAAQELARESAERAEHARQLERDLRRMAADNHFAQLVYSSITGREPPDSTGE